MVPCHLALDLSSTTLGWCQSHGGVWSWGEERLEGKTLEERLGSFLKWLPPRMPEKVLILERPHGRGRYAREALYGVAGIARAVAGNMGVEVVQITPVEIKRHWTGKSHATKEEMRVGYFQSRHWDPIAYVYPASPGEHAIDSIAAMSCFEARDYKVKTKKKRTPQDPYSRYLRAEAKKARTPPPPGDLVDALQDAVHHDVGKGRAAKKAKRKVVKR